MDYKEALHYIAHLSTFGVNPGLDRIRALLTQLGQPEKELKIVHIGGTNGKGSVVAYLRSILTRAGYRTGAFISPHITDYRERITIDGDWISAAEVASGISILQPLVTKLVSLGFEQPTEFEVSTALAFYYFARQQPDIILCEVGMGGEIDSTNVVTPLVSVLTSVSRDHMAYLGETLPEIAAVKAGIIKPNIPVVSAPQEPEVEQVLAERAASLNSHFILVGREVKWVGKDGQFSFYGPVHSYDSLPISLRGAHQRLNAAVALSTLEVLAGCGFPVQEAAVREGLGKAEWSCRQELLMVAGVRVLLDAAHNVAGVITLRQALLDYADGDYQRENLYLVLGILADKEVEKMVDLLAPLATRVYVVKPKSDRAAFTEVKKAVEKCRGKGYSESYVRPTAGCKAALRVANPSDLIVVTGSLYMVGEVRDYIIKNGGSAVVKEEES